MRHVTWAPDPPSARAVACAAPLARALAHTPRLALPHLNKTDLRRLSRRLLRNGRGASTYGFAVCTCDAADAPSALRTDAPYWEQNSAPVKVVLLVLDSAGAPRGVHAYECVDAREGRAPRLRAPAGAAAGAVQRSVSGPHPPAGAVVDGQRAGAAEQDKDAVRLPSGIAVDQLCMRDPHMSEFARANPV